MKITVISIFILIFGCTNDSKSIDDWNKEIMDSNLNLVNILVEERDDFFISINKAPNGHYAVCHKYLKNNTRKVGLGTWLELYNGNRKIPKAAANASWNDKFDIKYFMTNDKFDKIHFCYQFGDGERNRIIFSVVSSNKS